MAEEIDIKLKFDDAELIQGLTDVQKGLKGVEKQAEKTAEANNEALGEVSKKAKQAAKDTETLAGRFQKGISRLQQFAGAVGVAFGAAAIGTQINKAAQLAISYEQTTAAFETFLGSAAAARDVLEELNQFSIATPFEPTQVIEAGQSLLAFGFEASEVTTQLERVGNVAAGVNTDFNELAVLFGKARVSGRLFGEDINQLTERGIPIIGELAQQFGVAESEVKKLVETGQVSFSNLEQAFINLTSEGGKFFGLIEKQSQTVGGRISTLRGNIDALFKSFGERLLPSIGSAVERFNKLTTTAREFIQIPVSAKIEEERKSLNALVLQITDANKSEDERLTLINQLNAEYPTFLKNLNTETVTNEQLAKRLIEVNDELVNKIVLQRKSEELQKAADRAAEAREARINAEAEAAEALLSVNEKLNLNLDFTNKTVEERRKILEEATKGTRIFTASTRDFGQQLTAEGLRIDRATKALNEVNKARQNEIKATEEVKNITIERIDLADSLGLSLEGLTKDEISAAEAARKQAEAQKAAELEAQRRAKGQAERDAAAKKAAQERIKLLKELEKLTMDLAQTAEAATIEGEEDARKQSQAILDAQLKEIDELERTINEKAALLGKEVDISEDINALKEEAQREHEARITEIIVDEFKTRTAEIEAQAEDEAESAAFVRAQQLQQLETQKAINEAQVELISESADDQLTLEEFKQKRLLEIQLDFQRQRLELLAQQFGPDSKEVELLKTQIQVIESELGKIGEGDDPKKLFGNLAGKLADALGLDDEEFKTLVNSVQNLFGKVFEAVKATTDAAIEQNAKLIESIDGRIQATEEAFNRELELAELGLANNVQLKQQELETLQEEREKALEQQEQLTAQQNRLETIQQSVSLITASANIFQSLSSLGPIGIGIAIATIATMFGAFVATKARAAQITNQLADGGRIEGRSHAEGGHRIEGTNIEVEGREWVINKTDSDDQNEFLRRLNSGEFRGVDLNAAIDSKLTQKGNIGRRLAESGAEIQQARENAKIEANKMQLAESIDKQTAQIVGAIKEQPIIIQTSDGYIIKKEIKGRKFTRRVRLS